IQYVIRVATDLRGYAGLPLGAGVAVGDEVMVYPSRLRSRVRRILTYEGDLQRAWAGQSIVVCLDDQLDISRGDVLAAFDAAPIIADQFAAKLIWMDEEPLYPGRSYALRLGTNMVNASVTELGSVIDIATLEERPAKQMQLNDIGKVKIAADRLM